jgi:hypothetical protein
MFRLFFGVLIGAIGASIALGGLYVGIWLMLVGGIVDVIDQVKAPVTDSTAVAIGILKFVFCEVPIIIGVYAGAIIGFGGVAFACGRSRRGRLTIRTRIHPSW